MGGEFLKKTRWDKPIRHYSDMVNKTWFRQASRSWRASAESP